MEDSATPWAIAEVATTASLSALWVWASILLGAALVLIGGILLTVS